MCKSIIKYGQMMWLPVLDDEYPRRDLMYHDEFLNMGKADNSLITSFAAMPPKGSTKYIEGEEIHICPTCGRVIAIIYCDHALKPACSVVRLISNGIETPCKFCTGEIK